MTKQRKKLIPLILFPLERDRFLQREFATQEWAERSGEGEERGEGGSGNSDQRRENLTEGPPVRCH